jgi:phosphoglycerate dehydrogenase-like enzyme
MRTVLIMDTLDSAIIDGLAQEFPEFEFHMTGFHAPEELIPRAEIIATRGNSAVLARAKSLKWLHTLSAGVDTFLPEADKHFGNALLISNASGVYGKPISEHLLALMLAFGHHIKPSVLNMQRCAWERLQPCSELHGCTVGIVGLGDIGSHLAALLQPFGCEVLAWKRTYQQQHPNVSGMLYGPEGLDELLRRSDYVPVCLPGTPSTEGLIDQGRLALMKPTAVILNIGRGYIIDHEALAEALLQHKLGGACLDVTDPEPLPKDHPLWQMENVIITPHISGHSVPHWSRRSAEVFAENFRAYALGQPLPGAVDRVNKY